MEAEQAPINDQPQATAPSNEPTVRESMDGRLQVTSSVPERLKPKAEPAVQAKAEAKPVDTARDGKPMSNKDQALPKGVQKAIDKATFNWREEQRKREALEQKLAEIEKRTAPPERKMTKENFASEEEFEEYKFQQRLNAELSKREKASLTQMQESRQVSDFQKSWDSKVMEHFTDDEQISEYAEKMEAFGNPAEVFDENTLSYIIKSPVGPVILKRFADLGRGFAEKFATWHPYDQSDFLRRASAYYSAQGKQSIQAQQQPTEQQAPIKPIGRVGAGSSPKQLGEMSLQERIEYHRNNS